MKRTVLFVIIFGVTMAASLFQTVSVSMARPVNLTYSIFFPPTHEQCKAGVLWAKEVEKRSNGTVKITVFPGGTLTNANQCYEGVENGISDIGMSCFAYNRGRFPMMEAIDLPLGYPNGQTATHVANEFYTTFQPKELAGVKVLYLHAHGPGLLHTKQAVKSIDDLKGMKIRSTGLSAKVVEVLGAIPVAMPQPSTYEALQKGVVEGTFAPIETLKGWRQAEVIKYTTGCYSIGYTTAMFVVMNRNKWNSLPKKIQSIIQQVSEEWVNVHGDIWDKVDIEGQNYTLSLGNEFIQIDNNEQQRWETAVEPIIQNYITESGKKNIDGSKVISGLRQLIDKYSKIYLK